MFFPYTLNRKQNISFLQIAPFTLIIGLLLFSAVQQFHRFDFFNYEKDKFGGKTTHEKNLIFFGDIYNIAQIIQETLKHRHRGELVTDYDLLRDPYMIHHRALSYFFYPKVSLRFDNQTQKDILFLFFKNNPLEYIPENYKTFYATNDKNFVLAIEKKALK